MKLDYSLSGKERKQSSQMKDEPLKDLIIKQGKDLTTENYHSDKKRLVDGLITCSIFM